MGSIEKSDLLNIAVKYHFPVNWQNHISNCSECDHPAT